MLGRPFIGSEGEQGGRAPERNGQWQWCAIMVMKAAVSEGDQPSWWWGVMRGGPPTVTGAEAVPGGNVCAREVAAAVVGLGSKMTGRGPPVSRERRGAKAV
jgi:hypothetical protein